MIKSRFDGSFPLNLASGDKVAIEVKNFEATVAGQQSSKLILSRTFTLSTS